jgi:hypothetical protein
MHALSAAADLISDASAAKLVPDAKASLPGDILRLFLDVSLTWIAGSLPLRTTLPCSNVATDADVSVILEST